MKKSNDSVRRVQGASGLEGASRLQGVRGLDPMPPEVPKTPPNYNPAVEDRSDVIRTPARQHGKPFAFALAHGEGGASIWFGALITSVTTITLERKTVGDQKVNVVAGQSPIPTTNVHPPSNLETDHLRQTHLGWYGDVYLYWEADVDGMVTAVEVRGPSAPSGQDISQLNEELDREVTEGKYFIKLGTVDSGSPVDQIVSSDVHWHVTICKGDAASGSSGGGSSSEASSAGSSEQSSAKDSAIVPASSSPTGYHALYVVESPDVRFEDVFPGLKVRGVQSHYQIDKRFMEVIHPETLCVIGWAADEPKPLGFDIRGGHLVILAAKDKCRRPKIVNVKISAIRKGFLGVRFTPKSRIEFLANERRLDLTNY